MTVSETKIDFLGEMVGLDDLIKRIEELASTSTHAAISRSRFRSRPSVISSPHFQTDSISRP